MRVPLALSLAAVLALAALLLLPTASCDSPSDADAGASLHVSPPSAGGADGDGRGDAAHPLATLAAAASAASAMTREQGITPTVFLAQGAHVLASAVLVASPLRIVALGGAVVTCAAGAAQAGLVVGGGAHVTLANVTLSGCAATALRVGEGARVDVTGGRFIGNAGPTGGAVSVEGGAEFACTSCVFRNNTASACGGGVRVSGPSSHAQLNGCVLEGNWAGDAGGAVCADGARVDINNSALRNGTATNGGAVVAKGAAVITLTDSAISFNTAEVGGAIAAVGAIVHVSGGVCAWNVATHSGGCAYAVAAGGIEFMGTRLTSNSAGGDGGCVHAVASSGVRFEDVDASGNTAVAGSGGVLYLEDAGDVLVSGSLFESSRAGDAGGVAYAAGSRTNFTLVDAVCRENYVGASGACVATTYNATVHVLRTLMSTNFATESGGGIKASLGAHVRVADSMCVRNTAKGYYGGCAMFMDGTASMENTQILGNTGYYTGSVALLHSVRANMTRCVVAGSTHMPAVLAYDDAVLHVRDTVFANNTTPNLAAALYVTQRAGAVCAACVFSNNSVLLDAYAGGAVAVTNQSSLFVVDSVFVGNSAGRGGGAAFVTDQGLFDVRGSAFHENRARNTVGGAGGAILFEPLDIPARASLVRVSDTVFGGNVARFGAACFTSKPERMLVIGRDLLNCTLQGGDGRDLFALSTPPASIQLAGAVPSATGLTSGAFLPSATLLALDGYSQPTATDPFHVLLLTMSASAVSGHNVTAGRVALQGATQRAVVRSLARFSAVRILADPGNYTVTMSSSSPLFAASDFNVAFPVSVAPCAAGYYSGSELVDGVPYPVCKLAVPLSSGHSNAAVFAVIPAVVVSVALGVAFLYWRKRKAVEREARNYEVDFGELSFQNLLGQGTYGKVYLGTFRGSHVAIKTLCIRGVDFAPVRRHAGREDPLLQSSVVLDEHDGANRGRVGAWGSRGSSVRGAPAGAEGSPAIPSDVLNTAIANFMKEMRTMSALRHPNIVMLLAASVRFPELAIVVELMARGSLYDVYRNPQIKFDWKLRVAMARDAARGLAYLHASNPPVYHLDLKSLNLFVDQAMRVKVGDFGLAEFKRADKLDIGRTGTILWMAPEVIRGDAFEGDKADVFSYGIILWELLSRRLPHSEASYTRNEIAVLVSRHGLRPHVPPTCPAQWEALMRASWDADPSKRPSFSKILTILSHFKPATWSEPGASLRSRALAPQSDPSQLSSSDVSDGSNAPRESPMGQSSSDKDGTPPVIPGRIASTASGGVSGYGAPENTASSGWIGAMRLATLGGGDSATTVDGTLSSAADGPPENTSSLGWNGAVRLATLDNGHLPRPFGRRTLLPPLSATPATPTAYVHRPLTLQAPLNIPRRPPVVGHSAAGDVINGAQPQSEESDGLLSSAAEAQ